MTLKISTWFQPPRSHYRKTRISPVLRDKIQSDLEATEHWYTHARPAIRKNRYSSPMLTDVSRTHHQAHKPQGTVTLRINPARHIPHYLH